jgi:hypothetical protein
VEGNGDGTDSTLPSIVLSRVELCFCLFSSLFLVKGLVEVPLSPILYYGYAELCILGESTQEREEAG